MSFTSNQLAGILEAVLFSLVGSIPTTIPRSPRRHLSALSLGDMLDAPLYPTQTHFFKFPRGTWPLPLLLFVLDILFLNVSFINFFPLLHPLYLFFFDNSYQSLQFMLNLNQKPSS